MMLKANGEYLDFNGDIEIEKKIKLFEDIETADGDLSFAFEIELTSNNLRILSIPIPDSISKLVYQNIPCEVQSVQGITINIGSLRIERIIGRFASCSFLGGNSNWFAMLDGNMTELRLSQYDVEQNDTTIPASWFNTEGIVFPFLDYGALITRSYYNVVTEDFGGAFYLHTLFKEVFLQSGIKIQGELLNDSLFNQILVITNTRSQTDVNNNSFYVGNYSFSLAPGINIVQFDETSTPFSVGQDVVIVADQDFYFSSAQVIEITISNDGFGIPLIYLNGVLVNQPEFIDSSAVVSGDNITTNYLLKVDSGDYMNVYLINLGGSPIDITDLTLRVTPKFIYKAFGRSCVPLWTKQEFVSNVLRAFNVITSYNQYTKTVTLNLFDKIKTKQSIDISEFINVSEIDYSEFISNYARVNNFAYQEGSDEDLNEYNISSFFKYGSGQINADNYFTEQSAEVIELDYTSPISYLNPAFNASLERINFVELDEIDSYDITSVTDSSGVPIFNITDADDYFEENDLVRIESGVEDYNGDYVITTVTSTYIVVRGLNYVSSTTGTITILQHVLTTDDNVYWMVNIPRRSASDIIGHSGAYLNQGFITTWSMSFFNLLRLGRAIEEEYKQGLSFGEVNNPLSFQKTLIDKYWQQFERILNDPVKLLTTGNLPWKVYNSLDFLSPVSITTKESSNLYYVNRILGYKDSSIGCEVDLIKLP